MLGWGVEYRRETWTQLLLQESMPQRQKHPNGSVMGSPCHPNTHPRWSSLTLGPNYSSSVSHLVLVCLGGPRFHVEGLSLRDSSESRASAGTVHTVAPALGNLRVSVCCELTRGRSFTKQRGLGIILGRNTDKKAQQEITRLSLIWGKST